MPYLRADFQSEPADITLEDLIRKLLEQIPGTQITSQDWYAMRRVQYENIFAELVRKGRPLGFGENLLNSIDRAAESCGPAKGISIPMVGNGSLSGRISREFMLVFSDYFINQETVDRVMSALRPLGIVKNVCIWQLPVPRRPESG